ncbi:MAG TPA: hypothetical protein VIF64_03000 [Pyrinomonadaceae bacterium]
MITGFNTDIEHDGVVYHVQTEDKGLESPLILSLVYAGGEILASKRSRYEDLIKSGFDEEKLYQRLKRQHRLICAAINAGRLDELKRMSSRADDIVNIRAAGPPPRPVTQPLESQAVNKPVTSEAAPETQPPAAQQGGEAPTVPEEQPSISTRTRPEPSPYTVYDPRSQQSPLGDAPNQTGLVLTVLDDDEFRAGEAFTIRVLVQDATGNKQKPLTGVSISVKILGTTFRPQIYSVRTERDGVAAVSATMPNFTSGRAAVLIRAVANGETTEVRRVIYPAK